MAEFRLHIRPRLGSAMTLASDAIVPLAARAVARRAGADGALEAGHTGNANPDGLRPVLPNAEASPPSMQSPIESGQSDVRRSAVSAPGVQGTSRPALHLVPPNAPAEGEAGEIDENSTEPRMPESIGSREALISAAAKTLARRQATGTATRADGPEHFSGQDGLRRRAMALDPVSSPKASAPSQPMTHATQRPGGADALPGQLLARSSALKESAKPRESTGRSANPAIAGHWPVDASGPAIPTRTAHETDSTAIRPAADPKDRIAQLLMPALPDIVPEAANAGPEPESDFEFEMRVREALQKILEQDLLRHGLIAPEVL